jgi:nucleotide-binding universal stress UspA family protein
MKRLLVALDGSPRAEGVLASAMSIARTMGAKLVLFRAFGIPPDMALAWPAPDEPLESALQKSAQQYLNEQARKVPADLLDSSRVAVGAPWDAICKAARDEDVDLVVIGSHGFSGIDHLLGTTAAKVVNHADRSVLVVRQVPSAR